MVEPERYMSIYTFTHQNRILGHVTQNLPVGGGPLQNKSQK